MNDWDGMSDRRNGGGGLHPEAREQFARILERIEAIREDMRDHKADDDRRFNDHEGRVRSLEKGWWKASGAAAVIGAVIATVAKWKMGG